MIGACILPGPAVLLFKRFVPSASTSTPIIRSGHPRNTSAPITRIIPSTKRTIVEDPAVARYSFVAIEIINAPRTIPMISGLAYCTGSAE